MTIKIVSAAQHAMFERAAKDPAYAKERGISQDLAQEAMDAHHAAGQPKLPDRAQSMPKRAAPTPATVKPLFLSSRRGD